MTYLLVVLLGAFVAQALAAFIALELNMMAPRLDFRGALTLFVTGAIALAFGAWPGLFAAVCGAALIDFALFTPRFTFLVRSPGDWASVILYLAVGATIALLGGRVANSRRLLEYAQYEASQARREALGRADQLQSAFDAMSDAVLLYDTNKRLIGHNQALERLLRVEQTPNTKLPNALPTARDPWGNDLAPERMPQMRALEGESLTGSRSVDLRMYAYDGAELEVNVAAAPVRGANGRTIGAVAIYHDLSERRQREESAQKALSALIEMAQTLVATTSDTPLPVREGIPIDPTDAKAIAAVAAGTTPAPSRPLVSFSQITEPARQAARRLATQTQSVLDGRRVTIIAVDPEQEFVQPLAVSGMTPTQEAHMWAAWPDHVRLADLMSAEDIARLHSGNILTGDRGQRRAHDARDPFNNLSALVAPGMLRGRLVCLLTVDHGSEVHHYSTQERALANAVTQLAALAIERERLARERAQAIAREESLLVTRAQMDSFLTLASHELRTPLTTMKASIQMAARRMARIFARQESPRHSDQTLLKRAIDRIGLSGAQRRPSEPWLKVPVADAEALERLLLRSEEAIGRQERLVNDLLDVSRIQWDKLQQHIAPMDLSTLAQDAVEEQRLANADRTIKLELPAEPLITLGDSDRIRQALANYLINALRYSPVERPVTVSLSLDEAANVARVSVRDEGPGIPPGEMEHIWERFYRAPGVKPSRGSNIGLGLGLFISREIIQRHGGEVGARNTEGEGSGAEFWFTLPIAPDMETEIADAGLAEV